MTNTTQEQTYKNQLDFFLKYYGQLKGWTITNVIIKTENDYGWPQFWPVLELEHAKTGNKATIEVSSDEEGNEPGFLFIS